MLILPLLELLDDPNDEPEFTKFVERFDGIVMTVAEQKLPNRTLAEEAAQNTFIYFAKNFDKVKGKPYREQKSRVCAIAAKRAINVWNAEIKRANSTVEYNDDLYYSAADKFNFNDIRKEELAEAMDTLGYDDRQYLFQFYIEKKTSKEIAKEFGVSDAKVRKRIERARAKLRKILEVK